MKICCSLEQSDEFAIGTIMVTIWEAYTIY